MVHFPHKRQVLAVLLLVSCFALAIAMRRGDVSGAAKNEAGAGLVHKGNARVEEVDVVRIARPGRAAMTFLRERGAWRLRGVNAPIEQAIVERLTSDVHRRCARGVERRAEDPPGEIEAELLVGSWRVTMRAVEREGEPREYWLERQGLCCSASGVEGVTFDEVIARRIAPVRVEDVVRHGVVTPTPL